MVRAGGGETRGGEDEENSIEGLGDTGLGILEEDGPGGGGA